MMDRIFDRTDMSTPLIPAGVPQAPVTPPTPATIYQDGNPKAGVARNKPAISNVPSVALLPIMQAFKDGAEKYGALNWRETGVSASTYFDAAFRHLMSWYDGEEKADDSKVHHLGHAAACMMILIDAQVHGKLIDDRNGSGEFAKLLRELSLTLS